MCMWMGIKDCTTAVENGMSIPQKITNKITVKVLVVQLCLTL